MLLLIGCGRFGYDPAATSGDDGAPPTGPIDGATALGDGAPGQPDGPVAVGRPWDGPFTMEPPVIVAELNTPAAESECYLVDQDRTLLLSSTRPGGTGGFDIYAATRADVGAPFDQIVELPEIDSDGLDGRLVTIDGLVGFFHSDRDGGAGLSDMWTVSRDSTAEPWSNDRATNLPQLSTAGADYDPWLSSDGLRLYYVIPDLPGAPGGQDLVVSERSAVDQPFGPPSPLTELDTPFDEDNPAVSADQRFIVFGSDRDGGMGRKDLWFARRPDAASPFSAPELLPVVNGPDFDWEVCFSESGELFFSSDRPGGAGQNDIYRSRFIPLDP